MAGLKIAVAALGLALIGPRAPAQELEPRAYANAPVGLNFLIAGYGHTQGGVVADPSIPLTNADIRVDSAVLAYARSVGLRGRSAKLDAVLSYADLAGTADVAGEPRERETSGLTDARLRMSVNLYGAPALSLEQMRTWRQDLIVGASLSISVPIGQYDSDRLVNLGTNRWAIRPELGLSKAAGRWTLELAAGATFFSDNDEFLGGRTREQHPICSVQGGVLYGFRTGAWAAVSGTYYTGGRTTVDGVRGHDLQENSRFGITFAVPVSRGHSLKLHASTGVSTRTGTDFDGGGITWQYRWGGGS